MHDMDSNGMVSTLHKLIFAEYSPSYFLYHHNKYNETLIVNAIQFCRAIFHVAGDAVFWLCLIGIIVAALIPRFIVKVFVQHFMPSDIQIAREEEKFGNRTVSQDAEIEMNPVFDSPQR